LLHFGIFTDSTSMPQFSELSGDQRQLYQQNLMSILGYLKITA